MVLLEAMGNGLPQVAFDVRVGPRNLILEGETGYLVKDGDIETYAARVLSMFSDSNQWQKCLLLLNCVLMLLVKKCDR